MPNKRDLQLDRYGISNARYRELYYFCLQYPDWVKKKQYRCNPLNRIQKANYKEEACGIDRNIELVEQVAIEAAGDLYPWLLKAVTKGLSWKEISPPCYSKGFREIRKRFYCLLNLKK